MHVGFQQTPKRQGQQTMGRLLPACSAFTTPPSSSELRRPSIAKLPKEELTPSVISTDGFPFYSYSYSYSMAINTAHPGYGLSCCHGSLLQIRLNGYKREEYVASQPVREVVHTPLQHKQSSPQLQLLGATGWRPVPLSVAYGFLSIVLK